MSTRTTTAPTSKAATPTITAAPSVLLQRTCDCGQHTIAGAQCDTCSKGCGPFQLKASGSAPSAGPEYLLPKVVITAKQNSPRPEPPKFLMNNKDSGRLPSDKTRVDMSTKPVALPIIKSSASAAVSQLNEVFDRSIATDITFVKMRDPEQILRQMRVLDHQVDDALNLVKQKQPVSNELRQTVLEALRMNAENKRVDALTSDALELKAKQDANIKAKAELERRFGPYFGWFFWSVRGSGQHGETSPVRGILKAGSSFSPLSGGTSSCLDPMTQPKFTR